MNVVNCQHIQNESSLLYCPMKGQFQMHFMYVGTLLQTELLSLSCSRDKLCVVEVVVVHFV